MSSLVTFSVKMNTLKSIVGFRLRDRDLLFNVFKRGLAGLPAEESKTPKFCSTRCLGLIKFSF